MLKIGIVGKRHLSRKVMLASTLFSILLIQDETFKDNYITTIGVDFVCPLKQLEIQVTLRQQKANQIVSNYTVGRCGTRAL